MNLNITTPLEVVVDEEGVSAIRAEDASGDFGILEGHTDFLTVLRPSVLAYRDREGRLRYVAMGGGVLTVAGGHEVRVATREAYLGDDLDALESCLLLSLRAAQESERQARTESARLQLAAIRHIRRYLQGQEKGL